MTDAGLRRNVHPWKQPGPEVTGITENDAKPRQSWRYSPSRASEDEQVSSALSQIAAMVAGLALVTTTILIPGDHTGSPAKSLVVSASLAILAAVLISVARNLGS